MTAGIGSFGDGFEEDPPRSVGRPQSILPDDDDENDQDQVFVETYVQSGDAMLACVKAGIRDHKYPMDVVAKRQLARPEIKAAITAYQKIKSANVPVEVTRQSIIADMQDVYEKAIDQSQLSNAIAAKKLQAALLNLLQQNISITHTFRAEDLPDEELARIAGQGPVLEGTAVEVDDDGRD
jgi:hypothetical protein